MRLHRTAFLAALAALVAAVMGGLLLDLGPASAASSPPWEPDVNAYGTLALYNASGAVITSGKLSDHPFAAFAVADSTGRSGDTKATLLGATPDIAKPTGQWTVSQLSSSTSYPNPAAPGAVGTSANPVVTVGSTDGNLQNLIASQPNTQTDPAYANVYQLRLRTSAAGVPPATKYFTADLKVDSAAGTFTVIYPAAGAAPASASPTPSAAGTPTPTPSPRPASPTPSVSASAVSSPSTLAPAPTSVPPSGAPPAGGPAATPTTSATAVAGSGPAATPSYRSTTPVTPITITDAPHPAPVPQLADLPRTSITAGGAVAPGAVGQTVSGGLRAGATSARGGSSLPRTGAPVLAIGMFGLTLLYLGVMILRRTQRGYQGRHCAR